MVPVFDALYQPVLVTARSSCEPKDDKNDSCCNPNSDRNLRARREVVALDAFYLRVKHPRTEAKKLLDEK